MISANGGLPAHRYTPEVTPRWPRGSEPASRVPWALALCVVCFVGLALLGSPCALAFFVLPGRWPLSGGCPPPSLLLLLPFLVALHMIFFSSCLRPLVSGFLCFPAPGAPGLVFRPSVLPALSPFLRPLVGRWLLPSPLLSVSRGFRCFRSVPWFFFLLLCAPIVSGFLWFPALGALGLGAVFCLFVSASRCPASRARSPRLCPPLGRWLLPRGCCFPAPPSPFVSPRFRRSCSVPWFFFLPLCAFLCTYYHILCSSLAYFAFLQRARSNREGGWFSCLFQAKKNKHF